MAQQLDNLDRWLVRYLQDNPRATYATIARETDASESTIKRRVEGLIEQGVVTPAMIPDIFQLGYETSAFVGLRVDLGQLDMIAAELARLPETTMVAETMGRYDLIIFVVESSNHGLRQLVSGKIAGISGIRETETFVTPALHKSVREWRFVVAEGLPGPTGSNTKPPEPIQ